MGFDFFFWVVVKEEEEETLQVVPALCDGQSEMFIMLSP